MKKFLRDNGLSIVLFGGFFLTFIFGQVIAGWLDHNSDLEERDKPEIGLSQYLVSNHFLEATMENWESEFLQMALYVALTAFLFQRGSAESKSLSGQEPVDRDPRSFRNKQGAPWPVRRGGLVLLLYEHSLLLAFLLLFLISFLLHGRGGVGEYNEEQMYFGKPTVTYWQYFGTRSILV